VDAGFLDMLEYTRDHDIVAIAQRIDIDLAEDRERFAALVQRLNLKQPANGIARSRDEAIRVAERIGYPVLLRPSYVLGGRGMEIVDGPQQLDHYIATAVQVSGSSPVLIDRYLRDAIEVDVDAICDGTDVVVCGVLQHIEEAGVHSGDSACSIPPYSLRNEIVAEIERQARELALALKVKGLMNVQFAVSSKRASCSESSCSSADKRRSSWRKSCRRRASRSLGHRRTASILPRIASGSRSWCRG